MAVALATATAHGDEPPGSAAPEHAHYSWLKKHVFGRCVYCHGDRPERPQLTDYRSARTVVVPGNPEASLLYAAVASGRMPPGTRLSKEKVSAIYWWIANGAKED